MLGAWAGARLPGACGGLGRPGRGRHPKAACGDCTPDIPSRRPPPKQPAGATRAGGTSSISLAEQMERDGGALQACRRAGKSHTPGPPQKRRPGGKWGKWLGAGHGTQRGEVGKLRANSSKYAPSGSGHGLDVMAGKSLLSAQRRQQARSRRIQHVLVTLKTPAPGSLVPGCHQLRCCTTCPPGTRSKRPALQASFGCCACWRAGLCGTHLMHLATRLWVWLANVWVGVAKSVPNSG